MPSRAHTYTSPPPDDLILPYLKSYITFRTYCIFSLPRYPPLFLPTPSYGPLCPPSSLGIVSMYTIINGWACMNAERGIRRFSLFRTAFCGTIDCGAAVRGRIGWISYQVTFRE